MGIWLRAARPWIGDECRFVVAGCERTPRPSGYCPRHERVMEGLGMTVSSDVHVRSLRMPRSLAKATTEAARRLGLPENQFICQAVAYVCRDAGIPTEDQVADEVEDPW